MTTYRVIYQPTVFPRWRDFPDREQAETYLAMALGYDVGAEIVTLDGADEETRKEADS